MSSEESRDQDLERLLRRALSSGSAAGDACLDAETLAAWSDDSLRADEAQRVEAHVASCGRCQALLAAMVRTEGVVGPEAPSDARVGVAAAGQADGAAPDGPLWRRWRLAWLVPVAATATALAVWVASPTPSSSPSTESHVAAESGPPSPSATAAPTSEMPPDSAPASAASNAAPSNTAAPDSGAPPSPRDRAAGASASNVLAAPPTAAASSATAAMPGASAAEQRLADVAGATDAREATTAAAAARLRKESAPSGTFTAAPPPPAPGARSVRAAGPRRTIDVGIAGGSRWRVTVDEDDARAEFSEDGGGAWGPVVAGAADLGAIVAGATPGGRICWFVGRRGTVMLTLDGTTVRRVSSPSSTDLESVQPVDERRATVSGHGERYATTDGGTTWARVP